MRVEEGNVYKNDISKKARDAISGKLERKREKACGGLKEFKIKIFRKIKKFLKYGCI